MILLGRSFDSVFGSSVLVIPGPYVYFWIIDGILVFYRHGKQKQWCRVQSVRWAVQL